MEEYGGYLPFDLRSGSEFYEGKNVIALNCARNGIIYSILDGKYKAIYIPFYMCQTVRDALRQHGIQYKIYHFDEKFEPLNVELKKEECILFPNYYGLFNDVKIENLVDQYKNVILDNTQAFFATPDKRAYNVYSCRKFIGVSDGAYVIKENIGHQRYKKDISFRRVQYLFKSIELGTNNAYIDSLRAEEDLSASPILEMSVLTHNFLKNVDYIEIKKKRKRNFEALNNFFSGTGISHISLSNECVPMIYPLYIENSKLREALITNRIYIPQWWKYLLESDEINEFESKLVKYLFPLPIDQRYETADVIDMAERINKILQEI